MRSGAQQAEDSRITFVLFQITIYTSEDVLAVHLPQVRGRLGLLRAQAQVGLDDAGGLEGEVAVAGAGALQQVQELQPSPGLGPHPVQQQPPVLPT